MTTETIHAFVSGKVQGVFFRASTRDKAESLNIKGWVRNVEDGRVELVASGTSEQIEELKQWLWQGPPAASVDDVTIEASDQADFTSFTIRY